MDSLTFYTDFTRFGCKAGDYCILPDHYKFCAFIRLTSSTIKEEGKWTFW